MAAGEDAPDISGVADRRQALLCRPSIVARKRVAARAVKAVSRAQRGRSGIADARSALSVRVASRTITARRPKDRDVDLHAFNAGSIHESDDDLSG